MVNVTPFVGPGPIAGPLMVMLVEPAAHVYETIALRSLPSARSIRRPPKGAMGALAQIIAPGHNTFPLW
jgi:hypothetical protein